MQLEEVVVDARRHREDLQKVPISIAALSGEELDTFHLGMSSELQNYVPNLNINGAFNSTNPQIFIRGVGNNDYNDNAGATVGVYLDGVFLAAPAGKLLQMFDLDSAQVLRGPQGTLFGKNNTAGRHLVQPGEAGARSRWFGILHDRQLRPAGYRGGIDPAAVGDLVQPRGDQHQKCVRLG